MPIVGILGVNVNLHLSNLSPLLFLSYRSPLSLLISLISLISLTHSPHASNHLIRTLTYYPSPLLSLSSPSPLFPLILPTPLTPLTPLTSHLSSLLPLSLLFPYHISPSLNPLPSHPSYPTHTITSYSFHSSQLSSCHHSQLSSLTLSPPSRPRPLHAGRKLRGGSRPEPIRTGSSGSPRSTIPYI